MKESQRNSVMMGMRGIPTDYQYADGSGPVCIGDFVAIPWEEGRWGIVRIRYNHSGKSKLVYCTISRGTAVDYVPMKELDKAGFQRWKGERQSRQRKPTKPKAFEQDFRKGTEYIMGLMDYDNAITMKR